MKLIPPTALVIMLIGQLFIAGCGGESYTYTPENELKSGPGLFSGDDGEITLIDKEQKEKEEELSK